MASESANINDIVNIANLCADIILENGGETYRAEETVRRICCASGFEKCEVFAAPTGVFITVSKDGSTISTTVKRIRNRRSNLQVINDVNNISRKLTAGTITACEALNMLNAINEKKENKKILHVFAAGFASGFSSLLFGGGIYDFFAAFLLGVIVQLVSNLIKNADIYNFAISIIGGVIIGAGSLVWVELTKTGQLEKIITGAIMPLLPGLPMTNAIRDTMRGDLVSGVARGAEALLISLSLAFGVGLALKFGLRLF
jgi:uncharacterized membrane protein YjjP (DUF1212 family)